MKKKFFKKKKKLIKKLIIIKKKNSEQNSQKSNQKNDYNIFDNINEYNKPLPSYANLLDNYNYIQYKNIKIPRINFTNDYHFDNFKKPFNDLFEKINLDYKYTKDYFRNISKENNINELNQNIQFTKKDDIIIDIKDDNKDNEKSKILHKISVFNYEKKDDFQINNESSNKKAKTYKNMFKLYDKNKKLISKKRGKKPINKNRIHIHTALDNDNILRKIQVHFFTFLVSFTNDYIEALYLNSKKKNIPRFRNFDYKIKIKISQNAIEKMKTLTIGEILQKKASPKNKSCDKNINQITFNKLCEEFPEMKDNYFNKLFKKFFIEYYYNKIDRFIILNGININLSIKTEGFNKLIQKNINYNEKFRTIAACFYKNNIDEKDEKSKDINESRQTEMIKKPLFIID